MKLGSFWGLTAPMILLAYDDVNDIINDIKFTRDSTAGDIINCLHTELHYLKQASKFMMCELTPPESGWFSDNERSAYIMNGTVTATTCPQDMAVIDIRNELTIRIAQKILDGERRSIYVNQNIKCRDDIESLANDAIANTSFAATEIPRVAGKLYRALKSDEGASISSALLQEFSSTTKLSDSFLPGLDDAESRESLSAIYDYYLNRSDEVEVLFQETVARTGADAKVFDMELSDFLRKDPNFLDHVTMRWFKYITEKNSNNQEAILLSLVEDYTNNLNKLISMLDTAVVSTDSIQASKTDFDAMQYSVSLLIDNVNDFDEEDLIALDAIYKRANALSLDAMATKFGVAPNALKKCLRKACDIGICGLNDQSDELFAESVNNVILSDPFICSKSPEYLKVLQHSIANAHDIINNIKPLGAEIGE